jgi:hypothetical protein
MNRFATRTIALAAAATLAVMLGGIGVAVGSPAGDHARVAALSRAVKKLDDRFDELKGELNDLHNADETNRQGVSYLRRALIAPNVVKVVETRPLEDGGEVTVDAFCPRHFQVISGGYVQGASNGEVTRAVPIQQPSPGFEVSEFEQPGIGTGNQDTTVTAVAYCAPASIGERAPCCRIPDCLRRDRPARMSRG